MSLSLYELFISMGLFAKSIFLILAAMSIFSWTSAFQKLYQILRSQGETRRFAPEFSRFLQEEQLDGAIKLAEKQKKSHVARVVGEALSEVKPLLRDRATITAADINSVERAVEREILIVSAELKRGLGILATTGSTAPVVARMPRPRFSSADTIRISRSTARSTELMSAAVMVARSRSSGFTSESASPTTRATWLFFCFSASLIAPSSCSSCRKRENSGANRRVSPCDRRIWYNFWKALVHEKMDIAARMRTMAFANRPIEMKRS